MILRLKVKRLHHSANHDYSPRLVAKIGILICGQCMKYTFEWCHTSAKIWHHFHIMHIVTNRPFSPHTSIFQCYLTSRLTEKKYYWIIFFSSRYHFELARKYWKNPVYACFSWFNNENLSCNKFPAHALLLFNKTCLPWNVVLFTPVVIYNFYFPLPSFHLNLLYVFNRHKQNLNYRKLNNCAGKISL